MSIIKKHRLDNPLTVILDKQKFYSALPYSKKGDLFESCMIDDPADAEMKRLVEMAEVTYEDRHDDGTLVVAVKLETEEACKDFLEWGIENGFFDSINDLEAATPGFIEACGEDPEEVELPARIMYPMDDDPSNDPDDNGDEGDGAGEDASAEEPAVAESVTEKFSRYRKIYETAEDDKGDEGSGDDNGSDGDGSGDDGDGDGKGKDDDDEGDDKALTHIEFKVKKDDAEALKQEFVDAGIDEDDITIEDDESDEGSGDEGDEHKNEAEDDDKDTEYALVVVKVDEDSYDILDKVCSKKGINLEDELDGDVEKGSDKGDDGDGSGDDNSGDDPGSAPDFGEDFFSDPSFGEGEGK